jgi:tetratricopeptide (TPR) repeat protein
MKVWFCGSSFYLRVMVSALFIMACKHPVPEKSSILHDEKQTFSRSDSILSLPIERQVLSLLKWYHHEVLKKDSQQAITELHSAEMRFAEKGNTILRRQAWLMQQLYNASRLSVADGGAVMLRSAEMAAAKNWPLTQAECWHFAGIINFRGNLHIPAFEYLRKAQNVFDQYKGEKYIYVLRYGDGIAACYFQFGEYREAITYLKKTMQLPSFWNELIYFPSLNNTLGLCYQQLMQYDSAAIWYHKSYETAAAYKDSFYMALANGNLGYTYYLQQQYDKALPLLEADYTASTHAGETGSAMNAATTLAAIYIKEGQLEAAEKYMGLSGPYIISSGMNRLLKNWYENQFNLSRARGDFRNSSRFADSLLIYKDSVAAMRDKKAFNQEVLKLETEKHMNEVNQLESKRRQQILLRNSLLAGLVLLTIIALLWVNRQMLKRNKEKELARQQLQFAEQELINYTRQLKEKNDLLEQLRNEMDKENDSQERTGNINRLLTATILTEDDWKKFRELFEKVYPGFFIRLKEKMPDLSPTDTRLLALTKLQLPPKDMASMLGVSYDAVKKARQRLRKKINLPEEGDLEELVEMI